MWPSLWLFGFWFPGLLKPSALIFFKIVWEFFFFFGQKCFWPPFLSLLLYFDCMYVTELEIVLDVIEALFIFLFSGSFFLLHFLLESVYWSASKFTAVFFWCLPVMFKTSKRKIFLLFILRICICFIFLKIAYRRFLRALICSLTMSIFSFKSFNILSC